MQFYVSKVTKCVFCGAKPLSMEHVLPKWLTKLPIFEETIAKQTDLAKQPHYLTQYPISSEGLVTGVDFVERGRRPRVDQITVRAVCGENCNRGWMSALEVAVTPILTNLMNGRTSDITRSEMQLLRRWACKTAMMFEFNDKTTMSFTADQYSEAYLKRGMINNSVVSIVPFHGSDNLGISHTGSIITTGRSLRKYRGQGTPTGQGRGGVTVITLGKIALMVHNATSDQHLGMVLRDSMFTKSIWTPLDPSLFHPQEEKLRVLGDQAADYMELHRATLISP